MKVINIIPRGFCKGVVNAIRQAILTKEMYPNERIYLLGMIVHNIHVTNALNLLNIITLDTTNNKKEDLIASIDEGIIILTAHGTSQKLIDLIKNKNLKYIDTTCVYVNSSFDAIKKVINNQGNVFYIGKLDHPEANAAISISDKIYLITNSADLAKLPKNLDNVYVTNQTTMSLFDINQLYQEILKYYPNAKLLNEQCNATYLRQQAILNLDQSVELLFVVGDKLSNNSFKLAQLASNKCKSILIDSVLDINIEDLKNVNVIGVTSGASTPNYLTNQVITFLKNFDYENKLTHHKPECNYIEILAEFKKNK